jgi:hypothetical protein
MLNKESAAPQIWVMSPSLNYLYNGLKNLQIPYDAKGLKILTKTLEKLARLHGLYNMTLPENGGDKALKIEYKLFVPIAEAEWKALPDNKRLKLTNETSQYWKLNRIVSSRLPVFERRPEEALLSVRVENQTSRSYHIYGVNATPNAEIIAFLPGADKHATEVRPGETSDFTDHLILTEDDEYIRIYATSQPIDIYVLEQDAIAVRGDAHNPIEAMLREQLYPTRGRLVHSGLSPTELTSMGTRFTKNIQ